MDVDTFPAVRFRQEQAPTRHIHPVLLEELTLPTRSSEERDPNPIREKSDSARRITVRFVTPTSAELRYVLFMPTSAASTVQHMLRAVGLLGISTSSCMWRTTRPTGRVRPGRRSLCRESLSLLRKYGMPDLYPPFTIGPSGTGGTAVRSNPSRKGPGPSVRPGWDGRSDRRVPGRFRRGESHPRIVGGARRLMRGRGARSVVRGLRRSHTQAQRPSRVDAEGGLDGGLIGCTRDSLQTSWRSV